MPVRSLLVQRARRAGNPEVVAQGALVVPRRQISGDARRPGSTLAQVLDGQPRRAPSRGPDAPTATSALLPVRCSARTLLAILSTYAVGFEMTSGGGVDMDSARHFYLAVDGFSVCVRAG